MALVLACTKEAGPRYTGAPLNVRHTVGGPWGMGCRVGSGVELVAVVV